MKDEREERFRLRLTFLSLPPSLFLSHHTHTDTATHIENENVVSSQKFEISKRLKRYHVEEGRGERGGRRQKIEKIEIGRCDTFAML
jgi:hypothetical protein